MGEVVIWITFNVESKKVLNRIEVDFEIESMNRVGIEDDGGDGLEIIYDGDGGVQNESRLIRDNLRQFARDLKL